MIVSAYELDTLPGALHGRDCACALVDCVGRGSRRRSPGGALGALTAGQTATLTNLGNNYTAWKETVSGEANLIEDGNWPTRAADPGTADTIRNMINSVGRMFAAIIAGDFSKVNAMTATMNNVTDLIASTGSSNLPGIREMANTTAAALRSLVVGVASTAGAAAGGALKAAADELDIDPAKTLEEGLSTVKIVGVAAGVLGAAFVISKLWRK